MADTERGHLYRVLALLFYFFKYIKVIYKVISTKGRQSCNLFSELL